MCVLLLLSCDVSKSHLASDFSLSKKSLGEKPQAVLCSNFNLLGRIFPNFWDDQQTEPDLLHILISTKITVLSVQQLKLAA